MTDILAQYDINTKDLKEVMAPVQPRVQAPFVIDHAVMCPFFLIDASWTHLKDFWEDYSIHAYACFHLS